MRKSLDGHTGLENDLKKKKEVGDFTLALSYLKRNQGKAYFVVHAYSSKWHSGPGVQRSSAAPGRHNTFLDRLGFKESSSCNILDNQKCHYKVLSEVDRNPSSIGNSAHRQFEKLVEDFQDIYDKMLGLDKKLQRAGFELPYDDLNLQEIESEEGEAVYGGNQSFKFHKDSRREYLRQKEKSSLLIPMSTKMCWSYT